MRVIKYLFMLIGVVAVVGGLYAYFGLGLGKYVNEFKQLDPKAEGVYMHMMSTLLDTGDIAKATTRKVEIEDGISGDEVAELLNSIANERGIKPVGDLPLSKEVEARTGEKQRYIRVLSYCNPAIATKMVHYSMAFGAYLPCRITIMEDENGKLWMYTLDMDMMIHGGKPLPADLLKDANGVKATIYTMMDKAAKGEF